MTGREAAKKLIKPYILRGESIKQLAESYLGVCSSEYDAFIGGYMWRRADVEKPDGKPYKHLSNYQIGVERVGEVEVMEVFSLKEIYNEILDERDYGAQVPLDL